MRINLRSNFVLPGLEGEESVDFNRSQITLREFLEELSRRAPIRIEYVRPGARALDPDEGRLRSMVFLIRVVMLVWRRF
jgi:hypothetical protein